MSTSVYRKPTNTDRYIPFNSHHHPRVLTGFIRCMRDRALQVCDEDHRQQELHHLEEVFTANGFPRKLVKSNLSMPQSAPNLPNDTSQDTLSEEPKVLCLPYVRRLSEKLDKFYPYHQHNGEENSHFLCSPHSNHTLFLPTPSQLQHCHLQLQNVEQWIQHCSLRQEDTLTPT